MEPSCFPVVITNNTYLVSRIDSYVASNGAECLEINEWDVSFNQNFYRAFKDKNFNEPLDGWNMTSATSLYAMFYEATPFNGNISSWDVSLGKCDYA